VDGCRPKMPTVCLGACTAGARRLVSSSRPNNTRIRLLHVVSYKLQHLHGLGLVGKIYRARMSKTSSSFFIGVDVGTGSVRAGLVSHDGRVLHSCSEIITVDNPQPGLYHQSTRQVWECVGSTARQAVTGGLPNETDLSCVRGIGFDATCSLVLVDGEGKTIRYGGLSLFTLLCMVNHCAFMLDSVSPDGDPNWDVLMWLDHRAKEEADFINAAAAGHSVLSFVGGSVSLEMQIPKLLWIKKNLPSAWARTKHCFDLPDYLTWKATGGNVTRSLCSLVCKWNYEFGKDGKERGWNENYFKTIGLGDVVEDGFKKLGLQARRQVVIT
jgi:FGGY-family pentulose kinase